MEGQAVSFGPFRLLAVQRLLLEGDTPVRLGSRAFDILAVLVERAREVVSKEELIARTWPKTFVEDANLKIQISALRRALGDGQGGRRYIATIPGRGYNFVAPVRFEKPAEASLAVTIASAAAHNLPLAATRMIGREEAVATLVSRLSRERLLTIVGAGGIGKTTLALAVADRMIADYEDGVWLVDLAPLGDPRLVPSAVATVLGLEVRTDNPLPGLVAGLRDKRMLLLLDNCEHVIDAAASLAAAVLSGVPRVNILATSREPLGVAGEHEHRLGPLGSPPTSSGLTAAEAAAFPAVQLFVERVSAIVEDFALTDANAQPVVEICQRLDGLPLAIEFAAPRVEVLGVEGLAARLNQSLPLLRTRRRATTARHRTMRAVVDWSYGLLSEEDQRFFRALGIFAGGFTAEAVAALAIDAAAASHDALDRLADLAVKSLIVAEVGSAKPRFRLLDTTRAFALEKLDRNGDRDQIARHHAAHYRRLFERAEAEAPVRPAAEWLTDYSVEIDNLRGALDWAFSLTGDRLAGVALTAAAVPLWVYLSLLEECRARAKQALGVLEAAGDLDSRQAMKLYTALGATTSEAVEKSAASTKALDVAKRLGDVEYQLRALMVLYSYHVGSGRFHTADPLARAFHALTQRGSDRNDQMFGEHMIGVTEHYIGHQMRARCHLEQALSQDTVSYHARNLIRFQDVVRFGTDMRISARVFLARVLWLQGFADQAINEVDLSLGEAAATGYAVSKCYVLALAACPISLWVGDQSAAGRYTAMLLDLSRQHALPHWGSFGARFEQALVIRADGLNGGSRRAHGEGIDANFSLRTLTTLLELAKALGEVGRIAEALVVVEVGFKQFETGCFTPELLRLKGELSLLQDPGAAVSAEVLFQRALDGAREQGTFSWELRTATSLARLLRNQGRTADAIACLKPIYGRFTEGFDTADLVTARLLLDELSRGSQERPTFDS